MSIKNKEENHFSWIRFAQKLFHKIRIDKVEIVAPVSFQLQSSVSDCMLWPSVHTFIILIKNSKISTSANKENKIDDERWRLFFRRFDIALIKLFLFLFFFFELIN